MESTTQAKPILIRAKITEQFWLKIRKDALDRKLTVGEYVAQLLQAGDECLPPLEEEGVA